MNATTPISDSEAWSSPPANTSRATNTSTAIGTNCLLLRYDVSLPWNDPINVISHKVHQYARMLKDAILLPVLFFIGVPANLVNMAVFGTQGLKERINVCLFSLALVDLCYLLQGQLLRAEKMFVFDLQETYGPIARFMANTNLLGLVGLLYVSQIISSIIACERCYCILRPLQAQRFMKTSTTVFLIIVVVVVCVGHYALAMTSFRIGCMKDERSGEEFYSVVFDEFYLQHQAFVDVLDGVVFALVVPIVTMVIVTTATAVTAIELKAAVTWRTTSSSQGVITPQELALTRMLVYSSVLFIVFNTPSLVYGLLSVSLPGMSALDNYQYNLIPLIVGFIELFSFCNCTFHVFVYYSIGSRYRVTFWKLFGTCLKPKWPPQIRRLKPETTSKSSTAKRRDEALVC